MTAAAEELREAGIDVAEVSVGATPTVPYSSRVAGVTEIRPGTYIFNDVHCIDIGAAGVEQCALRVIGTVISTPSPDRIVIDAGAKSLSVDTTRNGGFGVLRKHPEVRLAWLNEEHGIINLDRKKYPFKVGDRLEVIPNHACMCTNQWDQLTALRAGRVEAVWPILARGKLT
jgi:D-serine deaminase-like pyridoxal phosphate-dependent protein